VQTETAKARLRPGWVPAATRRGAPGPVAIRSPSPIECKRDVAQWREVAARTDTTLFRYRGSRPPLRSPTQRID
jgi:hypothetical protein